MRRASVPAAVILAGTGPGRPAQAQERIGVDESRLDSVRRRIDQVVPGIARPGDTVTIRTGNLPAITPLRIGIGALRFGFEEVGQVGSTLQGEIEIDVVVPRWTSSDVTYFFIVFDFYFAPIALSHAFHVTDQRGRVVRAGHIERAGGDRACPALRGDDGELYHLAAMPDGVTAGGRVVVEATITTTGECGRGVTLEAATVRPGGAGSAFPPAPPASTRAQPVGMSHS